MSVVYLNGEYLPLEEAKVSVLDRGFLFADGVYEVIPAYGGRLLRQQEHMNRLQTNLDAIRLDNPLSKGEWNEIFERLLTDNPSEDQSIYLQVTRGVAAKRDHGFPENVTQTVFIMVNKIKAVNKEELRPGISAVTLDDIRWKACNIKSISLLGNILLRQQAHDQNAAEAILINDGKAVEGAASNVFIVKDGVIITPPTSSCLLPGITRDLILELAEKVIKESSKKESRLAKVLKQGDNQQKQLLILHKELDEYKNHLEEKVEEGLSEIKSLNKEIEDTQKEVVFTMGAIGESRSKETGYHVRRVAEYSKLIALYYGMSEEDAEKLKQASPMHDIGKIAIPDSILNKPGKLTDEEFELMKGHSQLGFDILKNSNRPLIKLAASIAYEHHERWDGKGYPNKLIAEEISVVGRITAVADVFDALGSDRCYKKAWPLEKILVLFKEEKSKQFDPDMVDILLNNIEEFIVIRDTFCETNL